MSKCQKCYHECHCSMELHSDQYGICTCEYCECSSREDDKTFENEVEHDKW